MKYKPICPDCGGVGRIRITRMAVEGALGGSGIVVEDCKACDGDGWLKPLPGKTF